MDASALLRDARRGRGRTLDELARDTRIPLEALAAIEAGLFERLPRGVYARAWIRTYAAAVGADPTAVLDAIGSALPRVDETLADICRVRYTTPSKPNAWRYAAAVCADAVLVLAVNAVIWAVCLPMCRCASPVPPNAAPAVVMLLMTTLMLYVVLFAGISGRTAGSALFDVRIAPDSARPLTVREIRRRAASYLFADLQVLAGVTRR